MCKYCQDPNLDDYTFFEDQESTIEIQRDEEIEGTNGKRIKMGISIPVTVGAHIWSPDKTFTVYIVDELEDPLLKCIDLAFPIIFCPMCGRKLGEPED